MPTARKSWQGAFLDPSVVEKLARLRHELNDAWEERQDQIDYEAEHASELRGALKVLDVMLGEDPETQTPADLVAHLRKLAAVAGVLDDDEE